MRQTLAIREQALGAEHPNTRNSRESLAAIEKRMRADEEDTRHESRKQGDRVGALVVGSAAGAVRRHETGYTSSAIRLFVSPFSCLDVLAFGSERLVMRSSGLGGGATLFGGEVVELACPLVARVGARAGGTGRP